MVSRMNKLPYEEAKSLIKEADVLLFRAGPLTKNPIGWFISTYTRSVYSHVGLAHWEDGELYCVEFREFIGSRKYPVDKYIKDRFNTIDVFRPVKSCLSPKMINGKMGYVGHLFSQKVAEDIITTAEALIGKKYGWWNIWQMMKTYMPLIRLRSNRNLVKYDDVPDPKRFVCSTLVSYAYRINYIDPVPFLCDSMVTPGDLARSSLFSYLFSIKS
jgi:hypothetical protein